MVLSMKLLAHQFDVTRAHLGTVREWARITAVIGENAHQHPAKQLHRFGPARIASFRRHLVGRLPVDHLGSDRVEASTRPARCAMQKPLMVWAPDPMLFEGGTIFRNIDTVSESYLKQSCIGICRPRKVDEAFTGCTRPIDLNICVKRELLWINKEGTFCRLRLLDNQIHQ